MDRQHQLMAKDSYQLTRAARRKQLYMAEMRTCAASLTSAVGVTLDPEIIIEGIPDDLAPVKSSGRSVKAANQVKSSKASAETLKPRGAAKVIKLNASKKAQFDKVAAEKVKKDNAANEKIIAASKTVCKDFNTSTEPLIRYSKASTYLLKSQPSWREVVGPECELYVLSCLLRFWSRSSKHNDMHISSQVLAS